MKRMGIVVALILLIVFPSIDAYCASPAEREALIALYESTNGPHWDQKTGWLGGEGTECSWYGVACENSQVTGISLSENQLTGSIPPEIGNLINLSGLYLYNNQLTGSIPPEIGNLTNILYLYLENNQLTGSIPPELVSLTNLRNLNLSSNQLIGSIPPELGSLMNLQYLDLSSNQLTGRISSTFSGLSFLETFRTL